MSEQQSTTKPTRFRILRRLLKAIIIVAGLVVLVAVVGALAIWGHFWDFQVGNPTANACNNCHVLDDYVMSLTDPEMLASSHAASDVDCVDCHQRDFEQQLHETIAYLNSDYDLPFARAQYGMETCFQCHEHGSYDQIAWRTTDLGVTDAQAGGHDANPHQPPHYTELECHSCHRMHRPSTLLCSECHNYEFDSFLTP